MPLPVYCRGVAALTPELLYSRTTELLARLPGAGPMSLEGLPGPFGPVWLLRCDRCGLGVNLLAEEFPDGWTAAGDLERGWTDLCPGCSS